MNKRKDTYTLHLEAPVEGYYKNMAAVSGMSMEEALQQTLELTAFFILEFEPFFKRTNTPPR